MAVYRYQVVCVGMWRGKIKRWNTTFHRTSSSGAASLRTAMSKVCYPNPGDTEGDCSGGIASISIYNASGGAPIQVETYFDWEAPSTWIPYSGSAWSGVPEGTPVDGGKESALMIVGHLPGLSASGKPMFTRKYIHAVPARTATDYTDPDIDETSLTALGSAFSTLMMLNPAGVAPTTVEALPYYGNHQRVRGRRRTAKEVAAGSFSAGVIVGAQPSASGGGAGAQFR